MCDVGQLLLFRVVGGMRVHAWDGSDGVVGPLVRKGMPPSTSDETIWLDSHGSVVGPYLLSCGQGRFVSLVSVSYSGDKTQYFASFQLND